MPCRTSMFSAAELAAMQECCEQILDQTATIQRNTPVDDGHHGERESWAAVGTVACHVLPLSGTERLEGERPVSATVWTILLPVGTPITARDRLVVGGNTYEITDLDAGASYPLQLAANARRVA